MALFKIRCRLMYHTLKLDLIDVFAASVRDGIFNNPLIFTTPPILQPDFQLLIDTYINTRAAYYSGGIAQRGPFYDAKDALMAALDTLALYVDGVAQNNGNIITTAGFTPTKGNLTPINPPAQPQGITLTRGIPGELYGDCAVVPNAEYYGAVLVANNPLPEGVIITPSGQIVVTDDEGGTAPSAALPTGGIKYVLDFTKARRKKFSGLQIGVTYYFYCWSANAGGVSQMSEGVSRKVVEG